MHDYATYQVMRAQNLLRVILSQIVATRVSECFSVLIRSDRNSREWMWGWQRVSGVSLQCPHGTRSEGSMVCPGSGVE